MKEAIIKIKELDQKLLKCAQIPRSEKNNPKK